MKTQQEIFFRFVIEFALWEAIPSQALNYKTNLVEIGL